MMRSNPVAWLRTVHFAPETTAPDGSVTIPRIVPVDWAKAIDENATSIRPMRGICILLIHAFLSGERSRWGELLENFLPGRALLRGSNHSRHCWDAVIFHHESK